MVPVEGRYSLVKWVMGFLPFKEGAILAERFGNAHHPAYKAEDRTLNAPGEPAWFQPFGRCSFESGFFLLSSDRTYSPEQMDTLEKIQAN